MVHTSRPPPSWPASHLLLPWQPRTSFGANHGRPRSPISKPHNLYSHGDWRLKIGCISRLPTNYFCERITKTLSVSASPRYTSPGRTRSSLSYTLDTPKSSAAVEYYGRESVMQLVPFPPSLPTAAHDSITGFNRAGDL